MTQVKPGAYCFSPARRPQPVGIQSAQRPGQLNEADTASGPTSLAHLGSHLGVHPSGKLDDVSPGTRRRGAGALHPRRARSPAFSSAPRRTARTRRRGRRCPPAARPAPGSPRRRRPGGGRGLRETGLPARGRPRLATAPSFTGSAPNERTWRANRSRRYQSRPDAWRSSPARPAAATSVWDPFRSR